MRHGSLFSGIGGFDLAAEWMGWENIFHCEWNPFGQKVLKYYFPNSISYEDITKTDFSIHRGNIDIISGGFPCQPYSSAGKRLGKEDERHLWPEMLRAIREIQPSWVVGENVRGLTNWNGGMVFDEVQAELEAEGYEVTPFLLPACAVNAPHRRDRIWFVAYSDRYGRRCLCRQQSKQSFEAYSKPCDTCCERDATNTNNDGLNQEWGHDRSSQNDEGGKEEVIGSTNTKESYGFDTHGNFEREPRFDGGIGIERYDEKNQTSNEGGISGLDNKSGESKGDVREIENKIQHSGTLVSQGRKFFQLSIGGGLEEDKTSIQPTQPIRLSDDLSRINRMDGDASNNAANTNSNRLERGLPTNINRQISSKKEYDEKCLPISKRRIQFKNFPTVSPLCSGDDGLSYGLDSITFSKWRGESIKAAGNAIVPQVVHQIYKAIEEYEKNIVNNL